MECQHSLVVDEGEHVCEKCGTLFERAIDEGAEWRSFEDSKEDLSRTGYATSDLFPESSYGSIISYKNVNPDMKGIQRMSCWSMYSNTERSWMGVYDMIQSCCSQIYLPKSIVQDACGLYKQIDDSCKVRGETRRACMGASVFITCRTQGASRTHKELADLFRISVRALSKAILRFEPVDQSILTTQQGVAERICSTLSLNDSIREEIMIILHELSLLPEDELEHTPKTIVAGVVARAMGLKTKPQLKPVSDVSSVSVLSIYKVLVRLNSVL